MKSSIAGALRVLIPGVGIPLMLACFAAQAIGIGASTNNDNPIQGGFWIVGFGLFVYMLLMESKYRGALEVSWSKAHRRATKRIALGNLGVNLGWPFAASLIGLGPASAVMAMGPVSVGVLEDIRHRCWKVLGLRVGVLASVVLATDGWELFTKGSGDAALGLIAASCAAWHFWNVAKCLEILGDGDDPKLNEKRQDLAMLKANQLAWPIIAIAAVVYTAVRGDRWLPDGASFASVAEVLGRGLFTAFCVFVLGIVLTNKAKQHLSADTLGVMFAFSPVVSAVVGLIGGALGLIQGNQDVSPVNALGILGVTVFAFLTAREQQAAKKKQPEIVSATAVKAVEEEPGSEAAVEQPVGAVLLIEQPEQSGGAGVPAEQLGGTYAQVERPEQQFGGASAPIGQQEQSDGVDARIERLEQQLRETEEQLRRKGAELEDLKAEYDRVVRERDDAVADCIVFKASLERLEVDAQAAAESERIRQLNDEMARVRGRLGAALLVLRTVPELPIKVEAVEDLKAVGLSDDQVMRVVEMGIRPHLVLVNRALGHDTAEAVDKAAELPQRTLRWYKKTLVDAKGLSLQEADNLPGEHKQAILFAAQHGGVDKVLAALDEVQHRRNKPPVGAKS